MAWTVDQAKIGPDQTDATYGGAISTLTTNVAVGSNCWILLSLGWQWTADLVSVSAGGLTWTIVQSTSAFSTTRAAVVYAWAPSGLASGTTITYTQSSTDSSHRRIQGASFAGGDSSSFVASTTPATAASGTTFTTGTITTTNDNELIFQSLTEGGDAATTATAPSVIDTQFASGTDARNNVLLHQIGGVAGSYTVAGTIGFAVDWTLIGLRMTVAAGGAAPVVPFVPHRMPLGV